MNLPNRLTVARLFLAAVLVGALSFSWRYANVTALVVFVIASLTDYFDGEIARRRGIETNFGRLMDPLADKVLVAAAFICLVETHLVPAWVAVVVIAREFMITGLRVLAATKGVVLSADRAGKHKTVWQIVAVIYLLGVAALGEVFGVVRTGMAWWRLPGEVLLGVALVLTLYSGVGYLWKNRELLRGL